MSPHYRPSPAPPPPAPPPKHRIGRALGKFALGLAAGLGLTVVFVGTLAVGVVAHLNAPSARRAIAYYGSQFASDQIQGSVEIKDVERVAILAPGAIDIGEATIRDPEGNKVLSVYGAHVRFDPLQLAKAFLAKAGAYPTIDHVAIDRVNVALVPAEDGSPTLGLALKPKKESAGTPPGPPKSASTFRFAVRDIDVRGIEVFGEASKMPIGVRGEVSDVALAIDPGGTWVTVPHVALAIAPIEGVVRDPVYLDLRTDVHVPVIAEPHAIGPDVRDLRLSVASGDVRALVTGHIEQTTMAVHVEVPTTTPTAIANFLGAPSPVAAPVALSVDASGTVDRALVDARARVGDGSVRVAGNVDLAALSVKPNEDLPKVELADLSLTVDGLSPRAFAPTAPAITVGTEGTVHAASTLGGTEIAVNARSSGTPEKGNAATLDLDAHALVGKGAVSADGRVIAGVGADRVEARFDLDQHPGGGHANVGVQATVPKIEDLKPFVPNLPVRGSVTMVATAGVDLGSKTFGAQATILGRSISHPSANVPEVTVVASASGPLAEPRFGANVRAPKIVLSPNSPDADVMRDVRVNVSGTPKLIGVEGHVLTSKQQDVAVATHLANTPAGPRILGTRAVVHRGEFAADMKVKEVRVDHGTVTLQGLELASTAGGMRLDAKFDPKRHTIQVRAKSTPLDLSALAYGLGIEEDGYAGKLQLDVDVATLPAERRKAIVDSEATESSLLHLEKRPEPPKVQALASPYVTGHVQVDLTDGRAQGISDVHAHVNVGIEDRLVSGVVSLKVADVAKVIVHGGAMVPGRIDDAKSWKDAVGHVDLVVPQLDLQKVEGLLAKVQEAEAQAGKPAASPPPQMNGIVDVRAHVERRDKNAPPSGYFDLTTQGLALAFPSAPKKSGTATPNKPQSNTEAAATTTAIAGFDVRVHAALDGDGDAKGENGAPDPKKPMHLDVVADVHDPKGPIAILHVGTEGVWNKLVHVMDKAGALADMPVVADMIVPPRALHDLPPAFSKGLPIDGVLGLEAKLRGTLAKPDFDMRVLLDQVIGEGGRPHTFVATTTYDGELAKLLATFAPRQAPDKKQLSLEAQVKLPVRPALEGKGLPWSASGKLSLDAFPLGIVTGQEDIKGKATGNVVIDHVNDPQAKSATVDGRIDFANLRVGGVPFQEAWLGLKVDAQAATGELALHGGQNGSVDVKGKVPLQWANAAKVKIAPGAPIDGSVDIKALRLKTIEPFVTAIDQIDGKLDAHIGAHVTQGANGKWSGAPEGKVTIRDGELVLAAVGERWKDLTGDITIASGKVKVQQISMDSVRGGSAKVTADATLDGFSPKDFHVHVDTKRFGVASSGAKVGDLSAKIGVEGAFKPTNDGRQELDVTVTLDDATMDLASEAGKKVQQLDLDPSITIGEPVGPPPKAPAPPGTGSPVHVKVNIPHPIWVRRDDLRIAVNGDPKIDVDGVPKFSGEVRIEANPASQLQQRSWLEVLGKRFYIQESHVRFEGNADFDPALDIHVRWQAPDRTVVKIDVSGHLSTPKVTFDALDANGNSAGLTQGEIMSLLVLGRRDAGSAQQQQQAEQGAAAQAGTLVEGMTGAIVGQQLQKILPTSMSLQLGTQRSSAGYQHDNVYFEVAYNAGGSQMGPTSIGQTQPKTTFGVEWRFAKMWSLMTTIGDTGSTLVDLLWHYRY